MTEITPANLERKHMSENLFQDPDKEIAEIFKKCRVDIDKVAKKAKRTGIALLIICAGWVTFLLSLLACIIYVAIHFISKWW
jgi:hypothetical protein